jgi:putative ABC transport system permease protein
MTETIAIGAFDLAVAALLVLAAGLVSLALRLGLGRQLALASVRTVV